MQLICMKLIWCRDSQESARSGKKSDDLPRLPAAGLLRVRRAAQLSQVIISLSLSLYLSLSISLSLSLSLGEKGEEDACSLAVPCLWCFLSSGGFWGARGVLWGTVGAVLMALALVFVVILAVVSSF